MNSGMEFTPPALPSPEMGVVRFMSEEPEEGWNYIPLPDNPEATRQSHRIDMSATEMIGKIRAILNKITFRTFDSLVSQLILLLDEGFTVDTNDKTFSSPNDVLRTFVDIFLECAIKCDIWQYIYSRAAALLFKNLTSETWRDPAYPQLEGGNLFQAYLIHSCNQKFRNVMADLRNASIPRRTVYSLSLPHLSLKEDNLAINGELRFLGSFCGHLYIDGLLPDRILYNYIGRLLFIDSDLGSPPKIEVIRTIANMFELVGPMLDSSEKGRAVMDPYFDRIQEILDCMDPFLNGRPRFLLLDLVGMRERNWNSRFQFETEVEPSITTPPLTPSSSTSSLPPIPPKSPSPAQSPAQSPVSSPEQLSSPLFENHDGMKFEIVRNRPPHRSILAELLGPTAHPLTSEADNSVETSLLSDEHSELSRSPDDDMQRPPLQVRGCSFDLLGSSVRHGPASIISPISPGVSVTSGEELLVQQSSEANENVTSGSLGADIDSDPATANVAGSSRQGLLDGKTAASSPSVTKYSPTHSHPNYLSAFTSLKGEHSKAELPVQSSGSDLDAENDFQTLFFRAPPRNAMARVNAVKSFVQQGVVAASEGVEGSGLLAKRVANLFHQASHHDIGSNHSIRHTLIQGFEHALASPFVQSALALDSLHTPNENFPISSITPAKASLCLMLFGAGFTSSEMSAILHSAPSVESGSRDVELLIGYVGLLRMQDQLFEVWQDHSHHHASAAPNPRRVRRRNTYTKELKSRRATIKSAKSIVATNIASPSEVVIVPTPDDMDNYNQFIN